MAGEDEIQEVNGHVTNKNLHDAVRAVHARLDAVLGFTQGLVDSSAQTNTRLAAVEQRMGELKNTTNEALHKMEDRIETMETPWNLVKSGWTKFVVGLGVAGAATSLAARFELWPF